MPIRCPGCGVFHEVAAFNPNGEIVCSCGYVITSASIDSVDDFLRFFEDAGEKTAASEIQREAEIICRMILSEETAEVDIDIAQNALRERAKQVFPDRVHIYDMIYESRFRRLREQFRNPDRAPD